MSNFNPQIFSAISVLDITIPLFFARYASNEYSFVSSSGIKELAKFGGCIKGLVPKCVESDIIARIREK